MNEKQKEAVEAVLQKKSVFITGPGGVGKSYVINHIKNLLYNRNLFVTALTGCAAVLIKGMTLHRWAGISPDNVSKSIEIILDSMNFKAVKRWRTTHVLIIDEVSMLSREFFETLDLVGRTLRNSNRIFGGIQLVFCGDFYQLPPIINDSIEDQDKFVFCSPVWKKMFKNTTIELTEVMRQQDALFVSVLNKIRKGIVDGEVIDILNSRMNVECTHEIKPTQLYSKKHEVDNINKSFLIELEDEIQVFPWITNSTGKSKSSTLLINQWENESSCEKKLMLAIGAQVVLLHNKFQEEHNLINGSRGVVAGFNDDNEPIVQFKEVTMCVPMHTWEFETPESNFKYSITQYPLKLAWALTIHKSQGMSLDCVIIDIASVFEEGQAYVALSRVKSLDGLYILNMDPTKIIANKTVLEYF
jgi:ATP-dependent DNA helicase PIF1